MPLPSSTKPPLKSCKNCTICRKPLYVPRSNSGGPGYFIDDIGLRCGHHFHRTCFLRYSSTSRDAQDRCALCAHNVLDSHGRFIVQVCNENGWTGGYDFEREVDDHLFDHANPLVKRKMTFLFFMARGQFSKAELFLKGEDRGANGKLDPNVRYEGGMMTAMHMAALHNDGEAIQLLLKYGADKGLRADGQTALEMAKEMNAKRVVALLIAEGN